MKLSDLWPDSWYCKRCKKVTEVFDDMCSECGYPGWYCILKLILGIIIMIVWMIYYLLER